MSSDFTNPPVPNPPPPPTLEPAAPPSFFQTWIRAFTRPSEATYAEIARSPRASMTTAFLWVFVTSLIAAFIGILVPSAGQRDMMRQFGLPSQSQTLASKLISLVCGAPVAAVIWTLLFAAGVGVIYLIARAFGGTATYERLAYVLAAIVAPVMLVNAVLVLLGGIPYVVYCAGVLSLLLFIYAVVLEIMAVRAANGFGWGAAIASVLIPLALLIGLVCCLVIGVVALAGSALSNFINTPGGTFPFPTP